MNIGGQFIKLLTALSVGGIMNVSSSILSSNDLVAVNAEFDCSERSEVE